MDKIFLPTVAAMNAEGRTFKGCLYFGLMLTEDGPKVIEYNAVSAIPKRRSYCPFWKATCSISCCRWRTAGFPKPK